MLVLVPLLLLAVTVWSKPSVSWWTRSGWDRDVCVGGPSRRLRYTCDQFGGVRSGWDQSAKREQGLNLQSVLCRVVQHFGCVVTRRGSEPAT